MAIRYYPKIRRLYDKLSAKRKKAAKLVVRSIVSHKLAQATYVNRLYMFGANQEESRSIIEIASQSSRKSTQHESAQLCKSKNCCLSAA